MISILKKLQLHQDIAVAELQESFTDLVEGKVTDVQIAAFLFALSVKGESSREIIALVNILREKALPFIAPQDAIDVCGTGGDGKHSLNISTAVAFVVAACGVKVAKHGNRSVSSLSGSSDVLTSLGVNINAHADVMQKALSKYNIAFLFAPQYHPSLAKIAKLRKEMSVRTIFNLIGPLLNPANVKRQLIGLHSEELINIYADIVKKLSYERVLLVNSKDGLDEISVCGETNICEVIDGEVNKYLIHPKQYGLKTHQIDDLIGGNAEYNAQKMLDLFNGQKGAYYDIILINAAFSLYIAKKHNKIEDSLQKVERVLQEKRVINLLNEFKSFIN